MDDLQQRARAAYERGRWTAALPWALAAIPFGLLSAPINGALSVGLAALTAVLLVCLRVAGLDVGRAVPDGLMAAVPPWLLINGWVAGSTCGASCPSECAIFCAAASSTGVVVLIRRAGHKGLTHLGTATAVAAMLASTACVSVGLVGLAAATGVLALSVPVGLVVQRT